MARDFVFMQPYLLTYFHSQLQFFQVSNRYQLDVNVRPIISLIFRRRNKGLKFGFQVFDGRKLGLRTDGEIITLLHSLAARKVVDPRGVVNNVRNLDDASSIHLTKYAVHQRNVFHCQVSIVDNNSISDIVWVFDEDEDT